MKHLAFFVVALFLVQTACTSLTPKAALTPTPRERSSVTPTLRPTLEPAVQASRTAQMATIIAANPTRLSGINYKYDTAATQQDRKAVESGVEIAKRHFGDVLQVTIHAYGDFNALCDAYSQFENRAGCSHLDQDVGMASGNGGIYINIGSEGWQRNRDSLRTMVVIHEYLHIIQFYLSGGAQHFKPETGPDWLIEGSADYLAYRAIDDEKLFDYARARSNKLDVAKQVRVPLNGLDQGPNAKDLENYRKYGLGFMACEFLAVNYGGDKKILTYFSTINSANPWQNAFKQVFGVSVDEFYDKFEEYRMKNFPPS